MDKYKVIIDLHGTSAHYLNGMLHNEDGPAVMYRGGIEYYHWLEGNCMAEVTYEIKVAARNKVIDGRV